MARTTIQLQITSVGEPMDSFLKEYFTKFFSDLQKPYPEFKKDCYQVLQENIFSYFDSKIGNPPGHDYLFNNLAIIWKTYQENGRVGEAQQFWQDILDIVLTWEKLHKERIHKGSLFYFWSQTAILQGQFDKGFFLIHSAYEEDVLTHNNELPSTPAFKTVALNYSDKANFLFNLVEAWANYLSDFLSKYRQATGSNFSLDDFQNEFLNKPPDRDTLFSFTYTLARFFDFDNIPPYIIKGNFASLFELNSLFDLVLVIDSVIYSRLINPGKNDWGFKNLANHLLMQSGLSVDPVTNRDHLEEINTKRKANFEKTLHDLLDQQFVYKDRTSPTRIECDIGITLCLRNYSAHNIGSFPIIRDRFGEIRQSIFNVLFLAIETA